MKITKTESGLIVPIHKFKTYKRSGGTYAPELTLADWDTYRGNNHEWIEKPLIKMGGSVSFKIHLGQPLSQELWEDLIHRFQIRGLCIYKHNESQWTLGWGSGHCIINLDEENNVSDIHYNP